jgi:hypothetical protein
MKISFLNPASDADVRNLAADLLPQITAAGIKTFITCEGFFVAERHTLGRPREKHPNWLGGLLPDDEQAGVLLAETLVEAARAFGVDAILSML